MSLEPFTLYNLAVALLTSVALTYLLYLQVTRVGYRRFMLVTIAGLLLYTGVGPVFELFWPVALHLVHGLSALLVILGLYDPLRNDLRTEAWASLLLQDPRRLRATAGWMVPMDDRILEFFEENDLVLSPVILAYNIGASRGAVNRRLSELTERGFVDRVDTGKYRITPTGKQYLAEVYAPRDE